MENVEATPINSPNLPCGSKKPLLACSMSKRSANLRSSRIFAVTGSWILDKPPSQTASTWASTRDETSCMMVSFSTPCNWEQGDEMYVENNIPESQHPILFQDQLVYCCFLPTLYNQKQLKNILNNSFQL